MSQTNNGRSLRTRLGDKQLKPMGYAAGDQLLAAFHDGESDEELYAIFASFTDRVPQDNEPLLRNCVATLLVLAGGELAEVNAWLRR